MRKSLKNSINSLLCVMILAMLLTGCGNGANDASSNQQEDKLTYWCELHPQAAATVSNLGDTPFSKELQKQTGVKIEYLHPPQGSVVEKFNIMIATDDLPDVIEYPWASYLGGPGKAIKDKKIIDLKTQFAQKAPELAKYFDEHPEVAKLNKTDDGEIFGFPFIRGDESLQVWAGIIMRQDWLDDLKLSMPETIDEWESVLTAFKDKKSAVAPLTLLSSSFAMGAFTGAYDTTEAFYIDKGKVKYGALEPGFKDFIIKMNDWYKKGLLDNDIASGNGKSIDSNMINGRSGASFGGMGGSFGTWMKAGTAINPKYNLGGAPFPVLKKGDKSKISAMGKVSGDLFGAITTKCKNVDAAFKVLNYGYTDKGYMLFNFGIEGESYNMVDGYPKYTDYISNNKEGLAMASTLARYTKSYGSGMLIQDKRYMEQYGALPQQQKAWKTWGDTDMANHIMPNVYSDAEESSEMIKKMTSITSYENEMVLKFIMGIEPMYKYDNFISELKARGIDSVLESKQRGYDRYLKR